MALGIAFEVTLCSKMMHQAIPRTRPQTITTQQRFLGHNTSTNRSLTWWKYSYQVFATSLQSSETAVYLSPPSEVNPEAPAETLLCGLPALELLHIVLQRGEMAYGMQTG